MIIALFDSERNFLKKPIKHQILPLNGKRSLIVLIPNLQEGEYAVSVIHDENKNQKLDTNFLGIPKEGFGFSKNPNIKMRAASYSECKFKLANKDLKLQIRMKYLL